VIYGLSDRVLFVRGDKNYCQDLTSGPQGACLVEFPATEDGRWRADIFGALFEALECAGFKTFVDKRASQVHFRLKTANLLPVGCWVRSITSRALVERLGVTAGAQLKKPLLEWAFFDGTRSSIVSIEHLRVFDVLQASEIEHIERIARDALRFLQGLCYSKDVMLGGVCLQFGKDDWGNLVIAEEIGVREIEMWTRRGCAQLSLSHEGLYKTLGHLLCV
jgi:phosphoribosylaminoimidazole-succinocarboxamide synthase